MKLHDRVVIVTGSSAGIGRATVIAFAQAGAHVVPTARRAGRLHALADDLAAFPGECLPIVGDVREETFAVELVARTLARFGRVDVLVNNAGIGHRSRLSQMPGADMRTVLDTNVLGLLYATRAAIVPMQRQRSGQIINVSSIVGERPLPDSAVYTASKAAVNALSRSLRMELRPYRIGVTVVHPGLTATEFADARLGRKGGNRFGLRGVPPERVARKIVGAVGSVRRDVYITWTDWLFVHLNRLLPRPLDALIGRGAHLA